MQLKGQRLDCQNWSTDTQIWNQSWVANCWNFTTKSIIKPMLPIWTTPWISLNVIFYFYIKRPKPTLITIKWPDLPKPSSSTWVDISITQFIGKTWLPSEEVEDNIQLKIQPLPSKSSNNSDHMKTCKKSLPRNQSQFKVQAGDGLLGTTFQNHWESLTLPTRKCWLLKDWLLCWVFFY